MLGSLLGGIAKGYTADKKSQKEQQALLDKEERAARKQEKADEIERALKTDMVKLKDKLSNEEVVRVEKRKEGKNLEKRKRIATTYGLDPNSPVVYQLSNIEADDRVKYEIEEGTNNVAEYLSLIDGLRLAQTNNVKNILVEGDSLLIINQINGTYKVNSPKLLIYHNVVKSLIETFDKIEFQHIRREFNKEADQLANKALDEPEVESKLEINPDNSQEANDLSNTIFNNHIITDNSYTGFE